MCEAEVRTCVFQALGPALISCSFSAQTSSNLIVDASAWVRKQVWEERLNSKEYYFQVTGNKIILKDAEIMKLTFGPLPRKMHRCQPSRNSRDSTGFGASVPCPARKYKFISIVPEFHKSPVRYWFSSIKQGH